MNKLFVISLPAYAENMTEIFSISNMVSGLSIFVFLAIILCWKINNHKTNWRLKKPIKPP